MVRGKRRHLRTEAEQKEAIQKEDVSIIPLAIPMTAGPGSMTTAIALMSEASSIQQSALVIVAIILVSIVTYLILIESKKVSKYLGETGTKVTERVMGIIAMVIGIQFIINGTKGVLSLWGLVI
jgi:multiple antibiotic resistance protein